MDASPRTQSYRSIQRRSRCSERRIGHDTENILLLYNKEIIILFYRWHVLFFFLMVQGHIKTLFRVFNKIKSKSVF